jgi:hypothetical protein
MRAALALVLLAACQDAPRGSQPTAPPPSGWVRFEHDLWWGHVPNEPRVSDDRQGDHEFPRAIALGRLPDEESWLIAAYLYPQDAIASATTNQLLDAVRLGVVSEGESLDSEQRSTVTFGDVTCPALRFSSHHDSHRQAATAFLCGRRMFTVVWRTSAGVAREEVEARRDRLLANMHLASLRAASD